MFLIVTFLIFGAGSIYAQVPDTIEDFVYQYRILGSDTTWMEIENFNEERISKLSGGEYVVEVRRINNRNGEINSIIRVPTNVPVYFWERISFWWLHIFVFLFLFWIIRKYEIKNKFISRKALYEKRKIIEYERTRIARDFHDGIGSSLAQCSILIEVIKEKLQRGNYQDIHSDFNLISSTIKNLDELLRDIIWSLDPVNNSFDDMVVYFRSYAAKYLAPKNIEVSTKVISQTQKLKFTSEFRRNIFFILKESLANIFKHSGAKRVSIIISVLSKNFTMCISDDGKGFDITSKSVNTYRGKGLININDRANALGGNISIKSEVGKGTEIVVRIPDMDLYLV